MGWVLKFRPRECNVYTSVQPHRVTPFTPVQSTRRSCPYTASTALTHSLTQPVLPASYCIPSCHSLYFPMPCTPSSQAGGRKYWEYLYTHVVDLSALLLCPRSIQFQVHRGQGTREVSHESLCYSLKVEEGGEC